MSAWKMAQGPVALSLRQEMSQQERDSQIQSDAAYAASLGDAKTCAGPRRPKSHRAGKKGVRFEGTVGAGEKLERNEIAVYVGEFLCSRDRPSSYAYNLRFTDIAGFSHRGN